MKFMKIRVGYLNLAKEIRDLKRSGYYQFEPRFSEMVKLELKSWKLFKIMEPSLEDLNSKLHEIWEIYGEFECHSHSKFDVFVKQMKNRISRLNRLIFEKSTTKSHVMNSGNSIARRELNTLKTNKNQIELGGDKNMENKNEENLFMEELGEITLTKEESKLLEFQMANPDEKKALIWKAIIEAREENRKLKELKANFKKLMDLNKEKEYWENMEKELDKAIKNYNLGDEN